MILRRLYILPIFLLLLSCADGNRYFEENQDLKNAEWFKSEAPRFEFEIVDTSASYHLFYNVRNTLDYPYYNLYLQYTVSDTIQELKSEQNELYLFDPGSGKPSGGGGLFGLSSFGDVYDHQYPFLIAYKFPHPGTYTIDLRQYMRNEDPLKEIMSIGIRIEKLK